MPNEPTAGLTVRSDHQLGFISKFMQNAEFFLPKLTSCIQIKVYYIFSQSQKERLKNLQK